MSVEYKDTQFRVVAQGFSTAWMEDTPSNRKAMVIFLRSLEDELGEFLFTYDQLAQVLESPNRQAAHEHMQEFEECGGDMGDFLARKRKVDGEVVQAVEAELQGDLWVGMEALAERVNSRLGRPACCRQGGFDGIEYGDGVGSGVGSKSSAVVFGCGGAWGGAFQAELCGGSSVWFGLFGDGEGGVGGFR